MNDNHVNIIMLLKSLAKGSFEIFPSTNQLYRGFLAWICSANNAKLFSNLANTRSKHKTKMFKFNAHVVNVKVAKGKYVMENKRELESYDWVQDRILNSFTSSSSSCSRKKMMKHCELDIVRSVEKENKPNSSQKYLQLCLDSLNSSRFA